MCFPVEQLYNFQTHILEIYIYCSTYVLGSLILNNSGAARRKNTVPLKKIKVDRMQRH